MAREKRLIDANWVLGEIERDLGCYEIGKLEKADVLFVDLRDVVRMVCDAPTVDAVEVVRCKDCERWKYDARKLCGRCDALMCYRPDYFWCMYGERRTDNG